MKSNIWKKIFYFLLILINIYPLTLQWWDNILPPGFGLPDANGWNTLKFAGTNILFMWGILLCILLILFTNTKYQIYFLFGKIIAFLLVLLSVIYPLMRPKSMFGEEEGVFTKDYSLALSLVCITFGIILISEISELFLAWFKNRKK